MRPLGTASFALAFTAMLTMVTLSACPRQKEGERCDFRAGEGDNSDCGDGLKCIPSGDLCTNADICCPDPATNAAPSHPSCISRCEGVGGGGGAGGGGGGGGTGGTGGSGLTATKTNGEPCTDRTGSECFSGTCLDGVCCATPCAEVCMSCNVSGSIGTCADVPAGQDPDSECAGTATCDGMGMCQAGMGGGGSGGTGGTGGTGGN